MGQRMQRDWVYPVLEDIRNFLDEYDMPEMASDIQELLNRYGPQLMADRQPSETDETETPPTTRMS